MLKIVKIEQYNTEVKIVNVGILLQVGDVLIIFMVLMKFELVVVLNL